jgi:hypothetical protein
MALELVSEDPSRSDTEIALTLLRDTGYLLGCAAGTLADVVGLVVEARGWYADDNAAGP